MKPDKRLSAANSEPKGFFALAKAHVAVHGGEWFVVERENGAQRQQWRAWMAYFAWIDDQETPRGRKAIAFGKLEAIAVPTAWPIEFDASAPPSPSPEPMRPILTMEHRRELADMLRKAVPHEPEPERSPGFERPRSPSEAEVSRRYHEGRLEALKALYASAPLTESARLRAKYASAEEVADALSV